MYKVAIVGAGIGAEHLKGYQANPDRFIVTTICDLDTTRGEALAAKAGADFTTQFEDVLASDTDLVDICLPPHLHYPFSKKAMEAGKHVICEKPLVASLREADSLAEVARTTGQELFSIFQYRFGLGTTQLAALSDAGILGKPYIGTLETHWNRDEAYYDVEWRGTWAGESGGAILGHAIHIHDLLCGTLGPISEIYAMLDTRVNDIEVEDCAAFAIRMENGALVTSSVSLGAADDTSRLRLIFEHVTVESDHAPYAPATKAWRFQARDPQNQPKIDKLLAELKAPQSGFAGYFSSVADALEGNPSAAVRLEDGRRSIEFVTAAYHSSRSGQPVSLPLEENHPLYDSWLPD